MQALPAGGAMVAIQAAEDEVRPLLTPATPTIAAVNGTAPWSSPATPTRSPAVAARSRRRAAGPADCGSATPSTRR